IKDENVWFQLRGETRELQKLPINAVDATGRDEFHIQEFGLQYLIRLGSSYDHGLYTDMSAIRHQLKKILRPAMDVLNLYSYTGAFSLWAMKNGAQSTVSVDLSPKYIEWLQQNVALNPDIDPTKHETMIQSTEEALMALKGQGRFFD